MTPFSIRLLIMVGMMLPVISHADTIYLTGSEAAANYLKSKIGDFEQQSNHQLIFDISSTTKGYESTKEGHIGLVSRLPWEDEDSDNLNVFEIGKEACLVIVNFHNPLTSITQSQIKTIFSGSADHWRSIHKEFNYPFDIYGPSAEADAYVLIEDTLEINLSAYEQFVSSERADKKTLRYVAIKAGGIGLVTESAWKAERVSRSEYVKVLYVDGVEAKPNYVESGFYPLSVPVYLAVNRDLSSAEQELLTFLQK